MLPRRIEEPVLRHPQRGVERALGAEVRFLSARRQYLQHEVRTLGFFPELVGVARMLRAFRRSDDDEHVRGHYRPWVALLVVEEHVPAHVHVLPVPEVRPEHVQRIEHRHELELGLRHRLVIRAGVVHHDTGRIEVAHRQVPPQVTGRGQGSRPTVPRPFRPLQSRRYAAAP